MTYPAQNWKIETWKGQEKQRWDRGEQHELPKSTCDPGSWHWTCKIRGSQYTTTITQTCPEQNPSTLLLMSIHLVINWIFVSPPIQIQTPNVMVFGGRASGRQWGRDSGARVMRLCLYLRRGRDQSYTHTHTHTHTHTTWGHRDTIQRLSAEQKEDLYQEPNQWAPWPWTSQPPEL